MSPSVYVSTGNELYLLQNSEKVMKMDFHPELATEQAEDLLPKQMGHLVFGTFVAGRRYQLYRSHVDIVNKSSETIDVGLESGTATPKGLLYSTSSLPHTLDELLSSLMIPNKTTHPPSLGQPKKSKNASIPVNLDASDGETSISDSGSETPVCVELPPQPFIREHTVTSISVQVSWTGPDIGQLVSFYELQLQEVALNGEGKDLRWYYAQTEQHLENLIPDSMYLIRVRALNVAGAGKWSATCKFRTMPPLPGLPLDPSPVTVTVRRSRKSRKKTIFVPGP